MTLPADTPDWHVLRSETLCDSPHIRVYREQVATPARPEGVSWTVARRRAAAVVAPRTPEGNYLLIRQERIAVRQALWEFPAGQVDQEPSLAAVRETALRELGEEAGMECRGQLFPMGYFFSSPGFTDECAWLFLATEVVPRAEGPQHDEHEAILEIRAFSLAEMTRMVEGGEIADANTLCLFARLHARGMLE